MKYKCAEEHADVKSILTLQSAQKTERDNGFYNNWSLQRIHYGSEMGNSGWGPAHMSLTTHQSSSAFNYSGH